MFQLSFVTSLIFHLFLVIPPHSAVSLPGQCPSTDQFRGLNKTADLAYEIYLYHGIAGVGFSGHPSHLFHNISSSSIQYHLELFLRIPNWFLRMAFKGAAGEFKIEGGLSCVHEACNSVSLRCTAFQPLGPYAWIECLPEVHELIHIAVEPSLVLLWSCVEGQGDAMQLRDEAVLIAADARVNHTEGEVRSFAQRYLTQEVVEHIQWTLGAAEGIVPSPFECKRPTQAKKGREYWAVLWMLLGILGVCGCVLVVIVADWIMRDCGNRVIMM